MLSKRVIRSVAAAGGVAVRRNHTDYSSIYYRATAPAFQSPPLTGKCEAEVGIVGGGFAGLATAMGLAERGFKDVALIEAQSIGHGASGRNGGFVFGGFSLEGRELARQVGLRKARELYRGTVDAVETIRRRIGQYEIECEKRETGVLLANWFDDDSVLEDLRLFMQNGFGIEWEKLSLGETRRLLHSERYFGALLEPNAFHFHPLKYARGLARTLSQAYGVKVFERSGAERITREGGGFVVKTSSGGELRCKELVMTCGGYIGKLLPPLSRSAMPIATYVMVTEPLGDRLKSFMETEAAVYDTRFAFDYYRPLADTRLLWGGRISIQDLSPEQVTKVLRRDVARVFPGLADVKIDYSWSGLMSYPVHQMPLIGQTQDGIWYAMGFGGHGVGPTTMGGELMAERLGVGTPLPKAFEQFGLEPTYGAAGLAAAQGTYWWLQTKDWLKE
jgi:gamma-glutamylputrescine oxidase